MHFSIESLAIFNQKNYLCTANFYLCHKNNNFFINNKTFNPKNEQTGI